jgi:Tn3 transposase DDE domain
VPLNTLADPADGTPLPPEESPGVVVCLRVLQCALVYVNTLMLQDVLADDDWAKLLTTEDRRRLTPLFWTYIAPYGQVKLDMSRRLPLGRV